MKGLVKDRTKKTVKKILKLSFANAKSKNTTKKTVGDIIKKGISALFVVDKHGDYRSF